MSLDDSTCWTMIEAAAGGSDRTREWFARAYGPVFRAYLQARWSGTSFLSHVDDAVQDVYVECFKGGGVLEAVASDRVDSFRIYLGGVARNIARRFERRGGRAELPLENEGDLVADDTRLSLVFDQAWALSLLRQAKQRQAERARILGADALRRVELLEMRFRDGLSILEIAERRQVEAAKLHQDYARARDEFKDALREVVAFNSPGRPGGLEAEVERLSELLG